MDCYSGLPGKLLGLDWHQVGLVGSWDTPVSYSSAWKGLPPSSLGLLDLHSKEKDQKHWRLLKHYNLQADQSCKHSHQPTLKGPLALWFNLEDLLEGNLSFVRWIQTKSPSLKTAGFRCLFACLQYFSFCFPILFWTCSCNFFISFALSSASPPKFLVTESGVNSVVLSVSLEVYFSGELIYLLNLVFFLSHKTRKYKIYLSSLFPFIISVKFGLPLTNPISVGIRASSFVFGLLKFSCYSRIDCSSSSWILYFLARFLCSFHICLERSIFLVCNQKKKSGSWFRVFYSEIFAIYWANVILSESDEFA